MAHDDEGGPVPEHRLGEPLDALSVEELELRTAMLRAEVARLEAAAGAKRASRSAAEGFFKR